MKAKIAKNIIINQKEIPQTKRRERNAVFYVTAKEVQKI